MAEDGIEFGDNNSNVTIQNSTIGNTGAEGIKFRDANRNIIITNNVLNNIGDGDISDDAIEFNNNNTGIAIAGNTFSGGSGDVFDFRDNNSADINNNILIGTFGDSLIDLNGAGNTINGSGNVNNAIIAGGLCDGAGNFTGTLQIDGVIIVDAGPPCI